CSAVFCSCFFFFNDTATTEIYTLSLHDALPISGARTSSCATSPRCMWRNYRSEEHTSELQSLTNLVCRLLLEKKKKKRGRENSTACMFLSCAGADRASVR